MLTNSEPTGSLAGDQDYYKPTEHGVEAKIRRAYCGCGITRKKEPKNLFQNWVIMAA